MSRHDGERTAAAMLAAGREIVRESGFTGLSLRKVAARARVNLGMFPYLFGSKEAFVRQVVQGAYDDFFSGFALETAQADPPLANLRRGLIRLARFTRDQRRLALSLLVDAARGHVVSRRFVAENAPRHARVIVRLIRQCQRQRTLVRLPLPVMMVHLMGALAAPHILMAAVESGQLPLHIRVLKAYADRTLLTDAAIARRVDLALKALTP